MDMMEAMAVIVEDMLVAVAAVDPVLVVLVIVVIQEVLVVLVNLSQYLHTHFMNQLFLDL